MCTCARMNVHHRRNCGDAANTNYSSERSAAIDAKASTTDSKKKLTQRVCSWQMFSTAASKGLLGVQGSNTEIDADLFFLVYMWDLLYMYLIYKNIFYNRTQVKVNVWRLFYPHNNKWKRETTLIPLSGKTEFLFCITSSKTIHHFLCLVFWWLWMCSSIGLRLYMKFNAKLAPNLWTCFLKKTESMLHSGIRQTGCRLRRGRPRTPLNRVSHSSQI